MTEINYRSTIKVLLKELFINKFGGFDDDSWSLTDQETDDIISLHASRNEDAELSFDALVQDCYQIDTKTNRPITQGFVCYNCEAYFDNQEDALAWLNRDEHVYDSWEAACEDNKDTEWECYYTEWH